MCVHFFPFPVAAACGVRIARAPAVTVGASATPLVHNKRGRSRCVFKFTRTAALERRRDRADRTWYRRRGRRRRWADTTWVRRAYTVPACAYDVNKVLILCVSADRQQSRRRVRVIHRRRFSRARPLRDTLPMRSLARNHTDDDASAARSIFFFLLPPSPPSSPGDNISGQTTLRRRVFTKHGRRIIIIHGI